MRHRGWGVLGSFAQEISPTGRVLVGIAGVLCLGNLASFAYCEQLGGYYFAALNHHPSGSVIVDAWTYDENSRSRYSPYIALSYLAPGSTVVVAEQDSADVPEDKQGPPDLVWIAERIYDFGAATEVVSEPGSALDRLGGLDVDPYVVANGPGGLRGAPWKIAIAHPEQVPGFPGTYLARALSGDDVPTVEARTFLLVLVPVQDPTDRWGYRRVLVDADLLPASGGPQ